MMLNREIYQLDPTLNRLENNGVAEVKDDQSVQALKTLRYEIETFVCDGEYEAGLDKILSAYLTNLNSDHEQPGVWISGFFGSGKSHLAKMLRAFWINQEFSDGTRARDIGDLPVEIKDHFKELSSVANRYGGLHAASGTLGSGANNNVRMALISYSNLLGSQNSIIRLALCYGLRRKAFLKVLKYGLRMKGILGKTN